jgi:hypothetical protein
MRQRLSTKFITFNEVHGLDFYDDLFIGTKPKIEEAIESIYNLNHMKATNFAVEVSKERAPIRGVTDGLCKVYLNESGKRIVNFLGVQEAKRDIERWQTAYNYQIMQGILYHIQFAHTKFILYPSCNYIDYILIDENPIIEENREYLKESLSKYSPSEGSKMVSIPLHKLIIHEIDMPRQCDLTRMWREIIKHCIDI